MAAPHILAIASGKGGVGKTLTSVNLALYAARTGLRTALVDADPLSNALALLDHPQPDRPLPKKLKDPAAQAFIAAPGLEVIFPQSKKSSKQASGLVESLLTDHRAWLDERYSLVIIDMPAGVRAEKDFPYLGLTDAFVLVTNPEPTAHVAAGTLLRAMGGIWQDKPVLLWHNRYEPRPEEEFDPDDVIGNYNRNVPAEEKLVSPVIRTVAYVPPDPALDLTRSDPPISIDLLRALLDALDALADASLPPIPDSGQADSRSTTLIAYFLRKADINASGRTVLADLESFIAAREELKDTEFPEGVEKQLEKWLKEASRSPLRRQALKVREVANLRLEALEASNGPFSTPGPTHSAKALDREMIPLLKSLSYLPSDSPMMRMAALLLYRFAMLKLFSNQTAVRLISTFLPHRMEGDIRIRDRRKQIARLTGKDSAYQARYFALVKKLYPVMSRQLDHLVSTFGLHALLFRSSDGEVARNAYARLFSASVYEMVNSGLGIVAGFRFRPSSRAFANGYEALMKELAAERN